MRALLSAVAALALLFGSWLAGPSRTESVRGAGTLAPRGGLLGRFVAKHPWWTAAAVAAVVMTGAAVTVVTGVVPIKASSGHWPITTWVLDFAKVRSVSTHSIGIAAPPLDDPALLLRGGAHYESGCAPCHGKPGTGIPPVMAAMTPPPPELGGQHLSRWTPEELFSIVKHGIKLTGMPAWPAQQRDDEVWAVVAFLRALPRLDATAYRDVVYGTEIESPDPEPALPNAGRQPPPAAVRDVCWRCHGIDGNGRGDGAFPRLAGQRSAYTYESLRAFANRHRFSGIMGGIAANLDDRTMREVAGYYERLPLQAADPGAAPADAARGEAIASRGVPDRDIPACAECHGPSELPKNPAYPRLAGQQVKYLTAQLELLKQRRRGGSPNVNLMHVFVGRLQPEDIRDVTSYYANLRTGR